MNIATEYKKFCLSKGIQFQLDDKVNPYDDSTLFCPAGMQQFKSDFSNPDIKNTTIANIQSCIRLNDYDEIADGTHLICFNMIGLFSFRDKSLQYAIDFWMEFISQILKLKVNYVTIHPDKIDEWSKYYLKHNVEIKSDPECTWSDDSKSAYCTEFYINDIEIGNIVNPNGDCIAQCIAQGIVQCIAQCIDAGFGYERLDHLVNGVRLDNRQSILKDGIKKIINSGYMPGPNKQGYILRKIIKDYQLRGGIFSEDEVEYKIFMNEKRRYEKSMSKYQRLVKKHSDKPKEWWHHTHGIDLDLIEST